MEHVLLVIQVLIAVALIAIILIQRSDSDGFGLGSGSGSNLLSGRATANLLTRTTAILAGLFMANALLLSILAAHSRPASIVDTIQQQESQTPAVPVVPTAGADKKPVVAEPKMEAPATETKPEVKPAASSETTLPAEGSDQRVPAATPVVHKPRVKPAAEEAPAANETEE